MILKRVGIMGGAFDPIHIGHLLAAEAAREQHQLDEVWFMPSHIPPHKQQAGVSGQQRLEMVEAAIRDHASFKTIDIELQRGGVSYTIHTVKELRKMFPHVELYFIIGADMVNYLPNWENIEELTSMLQFIGLQRPGSFMELDTLPSYIQKAVTLADMPLIDISSSLIRRRIMKGLSVRYMVPEAVFEYMIRSGLYGIHS